MKKLLLTLSFMTLVFTNIKATDNATINQIDAKQTEFSENNDQLILENTFDKRPVKDKAFFDLSIREIWNTKLKPFLTNKRFLALLLSSFSVIQICRLDGIAEKMLWSNDLCHRYRLCNSFDANSALLTLPHISLICGIIIYTVIEIIDNLS